MSRIILACLVIGLSFSMTSCLKDQCLATRQYTVYTPIYAKMEEHRKAVQAEAPGNCVNTGALYIYQNYIFINEKREGIHIVDNTNPENPTPIAFLNIPGSANIAVRNNLLYADNYVDLVVLDISNPLDVKYAGRTENVFDSYEFYEDLGHLIYYEESEDVIEVSCEESRFNGNFFWLEDRSFASFDQGLTFECKSSVLIIVVVAVNNSSSGKNSGWYCWLIGSL